MHVPLDVCSACDVHVMYTTLCWLLTLLQMALKFLEGAARDGFAAAYALIGKVKIFFSRS